MLLLQLQLPSLSFSIRSGGTGSDTGDVTCSAATANSWNISLFHYRNHGADVGRVLVGIQVPDSELSDLNTFLEDLG